MGSFSLWAYWHCSATIIDAVDFANERHLQELCCEESRRTRHLQRGEPDMAQSSAEWLVVPELRFAVPTEGWGLAQAAQMP